MKNKHREIIYSLIFCFLFTENIFAGDVYDTYKNTLLTKYGISFSFPEEMTEHSPQFNNPETRPYIIFDEHDTINGFTFFTFDTVIKFSPDVCILLKNVVDQKGSFEDQECRINVVNLTINDIKPYFSSQLFYNCNLPWKWWNDYEGKVKRQRDRCCKKYIQRSTTDTWVKESNAELGYITKFPHYEKIGYGKHYTGYDYTKIGSSYNACYGVELVHLYNPVNIGMLIFINTKKEKDVMKCIENICQYIAFDHSQVEELKQKGQDY
jgi:hypothetical protein